MAGLSTNITTTSLNINYLNMSIKRQKLTKKIKNMTQPYTMYSKFISNITIWTG